MSLAKFLVNKNETIIHALKIIESNGYGLCFVVDSSNKLLGIATDGDIRRHILGGGENNDGILMASNKNYISASINAKQAEIRRLISNSIKVVPLIDDFGKVVDYADMLKNHRIPVLEPYLGGNELKYVEECIQTNWISSQGSYVQKFEAMFKDMHSGRHAVAVSNGTTALHLALEAIGVGDGDEVIVPNLTFAASINSILYCKSVPVLCEINEDSWCISAGEIEKLITEKTKAIMVVHLYGQVCDMEKIINLAERYNLKIIEDCAEAIGSSFNGKYVGTFGDSAIFSFFGNKTISTGEGGMVLFRNDGDAKLARVLRDHGMNPDVRYWHDRVGYNYRITNVQAAIGVAQMERFPEIIKRKIEIAREYETCLSGCPGILKRPKKFKDVIHSNWLYTVVLTNEYNRDEVIRQMLNYGIESRPVFFPLSRMPPYEKYKKSISLRNCDLISDFGISLPTSVNLDQKMISYIVDSFKKTLQLCKKEL